MDVENREPLYTLGADVNLCGYVGKQYGGSSKKLKIELPYDPAGHIFNNSWAYIHTKLDLYVNKNYIFLLVIQNK